MKREVEPITKESQLYPGEKVTCPCSSPRCGVVGTLRRKPTKAGEYHVRLCRCPSCTGKRGRENGLKEQREAQKVAGIRKARYSGQNGNEEGWPDPFRWEWKSGAQVRPVLTAYLRQRAQADVNKAVGDTRPFAAGMAYKGTRIVVVLAEDWAAHVAPLLGEAS